MFENFDVLSKTFFFSSHKPLQAYVAYLIKRLEHVSR